METNLMDARTAWADFYENIRPGIWAGLSRDERRDINTAHRDYLEQRVDRNGAPIRLGADRVEKLLNRFAPGVYGVERTVVFWRVG